MDCNWTALINVLPVWLREEVNALKDEYMQEIRLRIGMAPTIMCMDKSIRLRRTVSRDDLEFCINTASRYSPWAHQTVSKGFITIQGGHRIGICGTVAQQSGITTSIRDVSSLCIRVCRQFLGVALKASKLSGNTLILGRPGSGKTTLLRDLIRCKSQMGEVICVVDERQELFPTICGTSCFECGENTDILSGCTKGEGIEIAIRLMSPSIIALDEITAKRDCEALIQAGWCGISLIATAHASSKQDYLHREIYRPLVESRIFDTLLILQKDKSWRMERIQYGN